MQKMAYLNNSRDYARQGSINENKYFTHINGLLDQSWKVSHLTPNMVRIDNDQQRDIQETFAAFVLLEKTDEEK